jgi:hypothetical protein
MKLSVSLATLCLLAAPSALAHASAPAWTETTAERTVVRGATVLVPAEQRASLRAELLGLIPRFRILENLAWDIGDHQAAGRIHNYRYRYSTALRKVEGGLRVTTVDCVGLGKASRGARFRHFDCAAISERLEIPSVELVYSDPHALPALVEREPRRYGPYAARLRVHVTGRSSIASGQVGEATAR